MNLRLIMEQHGRHVLAVATAIASAHAVGGQRAMPIPHQPYCLLIGFGCGPIDQRFDGAPVWRHPKTTHSAVPKVFDAGLDRSLRQDAADIAIVDKDRTVRG